MEVADQVGLLVIRHGIMVAPVLRAGDTVILESTSPVGTTEQLRDLMASVGSVDHPFMKPGREG